LMKMAMNTSIIEASFRGNAQAVDSDVV